MGKEIGGCVYVHRSYEHVLGPIVVRAKDKLPQGFDYAVVKYNRVTQAVSFVVCSDFDEATEPTVGDIWTVTAVGEACFRKRQADPYIYHHKWLLVADDYDGFEVAASKARSLDWLALPNVDRTRIGRRSYWREHVLPRLSQRREG